MGVEDAKVRSFDLFCASSERRDRGLISKFQFFVSDTVTLLIFIFVVAPFNMVYGFHNALTH